MTGRRGGGWGRSLRSEVRGRIREIRTCRHCVEVNMRSNRQCLENGFTLTEMLVILGVLVFILWCIVPTFLRPHGAPRIACVNNLKQDSLAFRLWSQDHKDKFPASVSEANEGAMEAALKGDLAAVFRVMSNELNTPKILVCPSDRSRFFATNFSDGLRQ